jgi:hypothetical protein
MGVLLSRGDLRGSVGVKCTQNVHWVFFRVFTRGGLRRRWGFSQLCAKCVKSVHWELCGFVFGVDVCGGVCGFSRGLNLCTQMCIWVCARNLRRGFIKMGVTFRDRICHRVRGLCQFGGCVPRVCGGCVHKMWVCFHTCIRVVCGGFRVGRFSGCLYTQCTKVIRGVCGCVCGFSMGQCYARVVHAMYTCEIRVVGGRKSGFCSSMVGDCYIFGFFSGFSREMGMSGG